MGNKVKTFSRADFDSLIARALEIDEAGTERLDRDRARSIALELGISDDAWDAALLERETVAQARVTRSAMMRVRARTSTIAAVGILAGGVAGALAAPWHDSGLVFGAAAIVAGAILTISGLRRHSIQRIQLELIVWWLSVFAGITIGMREFNFDPIAFTVLSWAGCALFGLIADRVTHRDPTPPSIADTSVA